MLSQLMAVTLSNLSVATIIIAVVIVGVAAGIFHDQSIKSVYRSFSSQSQVSQSESQTKVTLVSGTVSNIGGTPLYVVFSVQSGPSLSSGLILNTSSYPFPSSYGYEYQVYLQTGMTYDVRIYYSGGSLSGGPQSCATIPVVVTPTGTQYSQDFAC